MNCENALELMNRELDEALTAEESAALQAHLDACPDCRETWRQLHELDALLQESELEPPAALHDGVMRAIRQEQKRKPRRAWLPAAAIAAAAALVLLAGKAGLIAFVVGLFFGVLLVITRKGGVRQNLVVYQIVNIVINVFRSIPFIILLIFLIPLTRAVVGSAIGVKGAILPLVFGTVPFYTRQVEVALTGVNEGKVEAARSMGSGTLGLIFRVYLHEAVPELIRVTTVTAISLIGLTTMAGAVGAGGIGSFAINYGQNQNHQDIVNVCVVVLLIVVFILQSLGNALARRTTNRGLFRKVHK